MGRLNEYYDMKLDRMKPMSGKQLFQPGVATQKGQPGGQTPGTVQPQVDTSNAIGSLAGLMGPTPAEREARERRAQEQKSKMMAWTGLFDGLRQLGNLYYTTKGAAPQKSAYNPYAHVEQEYQQQRQIADAVDNYRRQYAQGMYSLRRQMEQDELAREMQKSTLDWRQRQYEDRQRQQQELLQERQRQFDERQQQNQQQFDARQKQQQQQFERKQAQQQQKKSKKAASGNKKTIKGYTKSGGSQSGTTKGKAY